jgi:hypothetical protein
MKPLFALVVAASLIGSNARAQETDAPSLMEQGAQMLLEGLLQQMAPALDEFQGYAAEMAPALRQFVEEMGPAFATLMDEVEDWSSYHPPEILPNGDIILRKKTPEEITPDPEESIEL